MERYEVSQSKKSVGKAYSLLMDRISEHVTVLAKNGKPITSIMGIKRGLFRYKRDLISHSSSEKLIHFQNTASLTKDLNLLVGDVLDKYDIDVTDSVQIGLVNEKDLKRVLIKHDYEKLAKDGLKYKDIKKQLSEQYNVSVSSIEKLVYR